MSIGFIKEFAIFMPCKPWC